MLTNATRYRSMIFQYSQAYAKRSSTEVYGIPIGGSRSHCSWITHQDCNDNVTKVSRLDQYWFIVKMFYCLYRSPCWYFVNIVCIRSWWIDYFTYPFTYYQVRRHSQKRCHDYQLRLLRHTTDCCSSVKSSEFLFGAEWTSLSLPFSSRGNDQSL